MPKINVQSIEEGAEANPELWNSRYATIVDLLNGKLDSENFAPGAVTTPVLATNSVTSPKVPDGEFEQDKWRNTVAFRATRTSNRNVGSSWLPIGANSVQYDIGENYSNTGNATEFTAPFDGIYNFGAMVMGESATTRRLLVRIHVPGYDEIRGPDIRTVSGSGARVRRAMVSTDAELQQGQIVTFSAWSETTVNLNGSFVYGHLITRL